MKGMQMDFNAALSMPDMVFHAEGTFVVPGSSIPAIQKGDMEHQAEADYYWTGDMTGALGQVWIRRAVAAEAFAKALEIEVERLRELTSIIGNRT